MREEEDMNGRWAAGDPFKTPPSTSSSACRAPSSPSMAPLRQSRQPGVVFREIWSGSREAPVPMEVDRAHLHSSTRFGSRGQSRRSSCGQDSSEMRKAHHVGGVACGRWPEDEAVPSLPQGTEYTSMEPSTRRSSDTSRLFISPRKSRKACGCSSKDQKLKQKLGNEQHTTSWRNAMIINTGATDEESF